MVSGDRSPESPYYREEPILIIEILSRTTERTDRNEKSTVYRNIPTLREHVIVWQEIMRVGIHRRQPDGNWLTYFCTESDNGEEIELQSINLKITMEEIYRRVKFEN